MLDSTTAYTYKHITHGKRRMLESKLQLKDHITVKHRGQWKAEKKEEGAEALPAKL